MRQARASGSKPRDDVTIVSFWLSQDSAMIAYDSARETSTKGCLFHAFLNRECELNRDTGGGGVPCESWVITCTLTSSVLLSLHFFSMYVISLQNESSFG